MARIRDPARDRAYTLWKEAGGEKAPKGILKEIAQILNISEGTLRGWKAKDKWNAPKKKDVERSNENIERSNRKKLIEQAKAMVISGSTLENASDKTGLNKSTLLNYSAKEKWIDQREKFRQKVYSTLQEEYGEKYISERKKSLEMLTELRTFAFSKLANNKLDKNTAFIINSVVNIVLKSAKGQSELIGIPEMKMYIRQDKDEKDLEKSKPIFIAGGDELED